MRRDSFERFYMEKVALGEGCGCAEMAINLRDAEQRTGKPNDGCDRGSVWARLRSCLAPGGATRKKPSGSGR